MNFMLCRNRVRDFAAWKAVFDSHADAHRASGLRLMHVWQDVKEAGNVFFLFEVADPDKARGFIDNPKAKDAGKTSGVIDGEYHFLRSSAGY